MPTPEGFIQIDPQAVYVSETPEWITMPYPKRPMQAVFESARFVNSPEFYNSSLPNPFEDPRYKSIPYPFDLGSVREDINSIADYIQDDIDKNQLSGYREYFILNPDLLLPARFGFAQNIVQKYLAADHCIYQRQKPCPWFFYIEASSLMPGEVLLPSAREVHFDYRTDKPSDIQKAFARFKGKPFLGLLNYAAANLISPEFPGKRRMAGGHLIHWGATGHLSPVARRDCFRVLVGGRPAVNAPEAIIG